MRRPFPKGNKPPEAIALDIKRDIPEKQLASLGALALAFNETEATLDGLFYVVTGLPENLQLEVSTRIGGIDGILEIIKIGAKPYLSEIELRNLEEALGNNWFKKMKIYRDGVIHCRYVNFATGLGVKVDRQANVFDFLIRQDALDAAFNTLEVLNREFRDISLLVNVNKYLSNHDFDDLKTAQFEAMSTAMSAQVQLRRNERLALPPFPEFPSESELREALSRFQKYLLDDLLASFRRGEEQTEPKKE